jgi:ABC-2 type transport system permease protein
VSDMSARIHDRGYRRYDGERTGVTGAVWTTFRHTVARILGLRRTARAKVLPFIVIGISYFPAIVFVGIGVFLPKRVARTSFPGYANYYGFIVSAILLFAAFVAPEALCPDRRSRLLGVYLTSPLDRRTYLLSKLAAVVACISGVTLLPVLIMALAKSLQGTGPSPGDLVVLIGRILLSGAMLALFYSIVSLATSSLTDRKGFAAAGNVLGAIVTGAVASAVRKSQSDGPDLFSGKGDWTIVIDLANLPLEIVHRIYGEPGNFFGASTLTLVAGLLAWTVFASALMVWRYQKLEVTR